MVQEKGPDSVCKKKKKCGLQIENPTLIPVLASLLQTTVLGIHLPQKLTHCYLFLLSNAVTVLALVSVKRCFSSGVSDKSI